VGARSWERVARSKELGQGSKRWGSKRWGRGAGSEEQGAKSWGRGRRGGGEVQGAAEGCVRV